MASKIIVDRVTPVVATGILAAGDAVSNLFALEISRSGRGAEIETLTIIDKAEQSAELQLFLFDSNAITVAAADAATAYSDADLTAHLIGVIEVLATDYIVELGAAGVQSFACLRNVGFMFDLPSGSHTVYGQLRTTGTPTYGAADAITVVVAARAE